MGEMDQLEAVSYLPTDVQLMVLDYVCLPRTSKSTY